MRRGLACPCGSRPRAAKLLTARRWVQPLGWAPVQGKSPGNGDTRCLVRVRAPHPGQRCPRLQELLQSLGGSLPWGLGGGPRGGQGWAACRRRTGCSCHAERVDSRVTWRGLKRQLLSTQAVQRHQAAWESGTQPGRVGSGPWRARPWVKPKTLPFGSGDSRRPALGSWATRRPHPPPGLAALPVGSSGVSR